VVRGRFRDLLAVIARAADAGMGMPDDHALRGAIIAHALALAAGLSAREARDAAFVSLLRFAGCVAESDLAAATVGDEVKMRGGMYGQAHFSEPREMLAYLWRFAGQDGRGLPRQLLTFARILGGMRSMFESPVAHCEVDEQIATRLGLDDGLREALCQAFECWNGAGVPGKLKGEAIRPAARVVVAADEIEAAHRLTGVDGAVAIVKRRTGRALDPRLCEVFAARAAEICAPLQATSLSATFGALALADEPPADDAAIEAACEVLGDVADLKCQYTRGHSRGVAELAVRAAALVRVPSELRATLRRAALLHDVGRVVVTASIWDKAGPLSDAETDRVRLHTLMTERILSAAPVLAEEAELAALAHERLDGRGYHRRLPAVGLTVAARVLAAADVYQALTSARPHRAALPAARAVAVLRDEASAGRLDGETVEAVLAAAGERPAPQPRAPAGLTEREIEVLRLVARGLTNKQVATELRIAVKTAGNHVQSTLGKIGVRTRSAAAMFAMRNGLVS